MRFGSESCDGIGPFGRFVNGEVVLEADASFAHDAMIVIADRFSR